MHRYCATLLLFISASSSFAQNQRLINVSAPTNGRFPWAVHVQSMEYVWTGSLVRPDYVLTWGSFSTQLFYTPIYVKPISEQNNWRTVAKVFMHPCIRTHREDHPRHDLSLLKVDKPFRLDDGRVSAIGLAPPLGNSFFSMMNTFDRWIGQEAVVVAMEENVAQLSERMFYSKVRVLSAEAMRRKYNAGDAVMRNLSQRAFDQWLIQARSPRISTCFIDSGGPLVVGNVLAGVVINGFGKGGAESCDNSDHPKQYVRIDLNRKWIDYVLLTGQQYPASTDCTFCWLRDNEDLDFAKILQTSCIAACKDR